MRQAWRRDYRRPPTIPAGNGLSLISVALHSLRWKFADAPDSFGARRRAQRWQWLLRTFPDLDQMSVLDLGGSLSTWERAAIRARHVHVVNIVAPPTEVPDWAEVDVGDACALPSHIMKRRYDLVFSNSV